MNGAVETAVCKIKRLQVIGSMAVEVCNLTRSKEIVIWSTEFQNCHCSEVVNDATLMLTYLPRKLQIL